MKKKLLALAVLGTVATATLAGKVGFEPIFYLNSGAVLLIDRDTITPLPQTFAEKAKSLVGGPKANRTVWELLNTASPDAPFKSAKILQEINCNTRSTNAVSFTSYTKLNGDGDVIGSGNPQPDWQHAIPGTAGAALVDAVCK